MKKFFVFLLKQHALRLAGAVFIAGAMLSLAAGWMMHQRVQERELLQYHAIAQRTALEVSQRLRHPLYLLNGARSHYLGSQDVTRSEFSDYVFSRDLATEFPGVRGLGFIERIERPDLPHWLARERADEAPDFQVRTLINNPSDTLYVIKLIQPAIDNAGAQGLDLGSEPLRRSSIEQAIDSGQATMTAPIALVQDASNSAGILIYLPVYYSVARLNSAMERRIALRGVLYTPVVINELMAGIDAIANQSLHITLTDQDGVNPSLLFENTTRPGQRFESTQTLVVSGRTLALKLRSSARFDAAQSQALPWLISLGGLLISALLALLVWLQSHARQRAEALAASMTQDLSRLALVARNTSNLVIITDAQRCITWVNPGFERTTGYSSAEVIGKSPSLLQTDATDRSTIAQMHTAFAAGQGFQGEVLNCSKDGRSYWLSMDIQPLREADGSLSGYVAIQSDVTERRRTQNQLETLLRDNSALMSTLDLFGIVSTADRDGIITSANDALCDISGYSRAELVGQNHRLLNSGHHPLAFWQDLWRSITAGQAWRGEICNRSKAGELYWMDSFIAPFVGDDGQVEKFVSIRIDITARKRVQEQLRWSQSLLQMMSESSPLGFFVVDERDDRILYFNARFCEIWGIGDLAASLTSGDTRLPALLSYVQPLLADSSALMAVNSQLHDVAQRMTLEDEISLIFDRTVRRYTTQVRDAGDQYIGRFYLFEDITERRRSKALAQRNAEVLSNAVDALGDAFVLFDDKDRLVMCNQRFRDICTGFADKVVPGITFEAVLREGMAQGQFAKEVPLDLQEQWVAARLAQRRQPQSESRQKLGDGRTLRVVERRMPNGYTVGFRVDITELVHATEAAEQASKSKSQFLANMSHEIRTPLNAVLGMLALLQKTPLSPQQTDYACKGDVAARSLLALLNDILDLSKAEAGKMTLDPQPQDLSQLASDVEVIVHAYIHARPVNFALQLGADLPQRVVVDAMRLKQVLINLCSNAVKFTERGDVTLSVEAVDRSGDLVLLKFAVQDSGIGIAPENQARIFSGFTQAEASTTRRFGGTGLGLAISQRLVEAMGGKLELQSKLGAGSRFYFSLKLPLADDVQQEQQATASMMALLDDGAAGPVARLAGMRILVAEDNFVNQQIASELLEGEGAVVDLANNGKEALDQVNTAGSAYDVVLMDMQMPVMDGLDATRAIRLRHSAQALPIVAMTANAMDTDRQACLEAGMNDHVGKPFDLDHLVGVLNQVRKKHI